MTITKIFDAAYPPASAPAGCKGVLGYIGGPNAYHTWTLEEWQPFSHLVQFPCWVPELTGNPEAQAAAAVAAAKQLGWAAHEPAASERAIIFDLENTVERHLVADVRRGRQRRRIHSGRLRVPIHGSPERRLGRLGRQLEGRSRPPGRPDGPWHSVSGQCALQRNIR